MRVKIALSGGAALRMFTLTLALLATASISEIVLAADSTPPAPKVIELGAPPAGTPRPTEPPAGATLPQPDANPKLAKNAAGQVVQIKALDDPANPYRGQYTDYDRWFVEHYAPSVSKEEENNFGRWMTQDSAAFQAKYPEHWAVGRMWVDANGFPIPIHVFGRMLRASFEHKTIREYVNYSQWADPLMRGYSFFGVGVRDPELRKRDAEASWSTDLAGDPPIPGWLGESLPLAVVFVPNGDVLTYGELGLHVLDAYGKEDQSPRGEKWYRYDKDGKLLGSYLLQFQHHDGYYGDWLNLPDWRQIYNPNIDKVLAAQPALKRVVQQAGDGYTVIIEGNDDPPRSMYDQDDDVPKNRTILAAYDYDGSVVLPDMPLPTDRRFCCRVYQRDWLANIYKHQLALGLTTNAPSPYAGTPDGPVAVDPTPRRAKPMARRLNPHEDGDNRPDTIPLRDLDDPANPFRGQYSAYDKWVFENAGRQNPRELAFRQGRSFDAQEKGAGGNDHVFILNRPYEPGLDDPWYSAGGTVDDQGFLIPQVIQQQKTRANFNSRDLRLPAQMPPTEYYVSAGGEIDLQTKAAGLRAKWDVIGPDFPRVPDWLHAKPVLMAVFGPDSDMWTLGSLGSGPPDATWRVFRDEAIWDKVEKAWYRYHPDGTFVSKMPFELFAHDSMAPASLPKELRLPRDYPHDLWMDAYFPDYSKKKAELEAQGQDMFTDRGYVVVWHRGKDQDWASGSLAAAYDLYGNPVSLEQPIIPKPGHLAELSSWDQLDELWRWQHGQL